MTASSDLHVPRRGRVRWPWIPSTVVGALTFGVMAMLYAGRPLTGIALASASNMAVFTFFLVGGVVLTTRAAGGPAPWWAVVARPAVLGLIPGLGCWLAVVILRQAILADESLAETVFTDGYGRAIVVYQAAVLIGVIAEFTVRAVRAIRAEKQS